MTSAADLYTICPALRVNIAVSNLRVKHAHHYKIDDSASYLYLSSPTWVAYTVVGTYVGDWVTLAILKAWSGGMKKKKMRGNNRFNDSADSLVSQPFGFFFLFFTPTIICYPSNIASWCFNFIYNRSWFVGKAWKKLILWRDALILFGRQTCWCLEVFATVSLREPQAHKSYPWYS